jgi:hypothetical protein
MERVNITMKRGFSGPNRGEINQGFACEENRGFAAQ